MDDAAADKPDLVAFIGNHEVAQKVINGDTIKTPLLSAHELVTAVESKTKNDAKEQCRRYVYSISRHRPASCLQYGLVANKTSFRLISVGLDDQIEWDEVRWDSDKCIGKLYTCVKLIQDEALRETSPSIPKFLTMLKVGSVAIAAYKANVKEMDYYLLPIYSGRGSGRKPSIALGYPKSDPNNRDQWRVFKYSWRVEKRTKESEIQILKTIHENGRVPGVVRMDATLSNPSLEKVGQEGGVRERGLLVHNSIGYPLCSCESVQQFFEVIYDLLEGG